MQLTLVNAIDACALLTFDQHLDGAVGQLQHLQNRRNATDIKHVGDQRIIFSRGFLRDQHDATICFHGRFQGLDAFGSSHKQGDDHVREHHDISQWQQWQIDRGSRQWGMTRHGETFLLPVKNKWEPGRGRLQRIVHVALCAKLE